MRTLLLSAAIAFAASTGAAYVAHHSLWFRARLPTSSERLSRAKPHQSPA